MRRLRDALLVTGLTVGWLLFFDVCLGRAFRMPSDVHATPSTLQRYFEYGRSVEGKLRRVVRASDAETAPGMESAWLGSITAPPAKRPSHGEILLSAYGQSFTDNVARALERVEPRIHVRSINGPAAPLSHSFALYERDPEQRVSDVVMIGVLASSLPRLVSMTNLTAEFEEPVPYTYPRFFVRGGKLTRVDPPVDTLDGLRRALSDPASWRRYREHLAAYDDAFDSFIFERDWLDGFVFGRVLRRGMGQRHAREVAERFHDSNGFHNTGGILDVAAAVLSEFAKKARANGQAACVCLFNDRGYGTHLYEALGPRLRKAGVPFFSSHEVAPPGDTKSFVPDGHFTPALEERFAATIAPEILRIAGVAASDASDR